MDSGLRQNDAFLGQGAIGLRQNDAFLGQGPLACARMTPSLDVRNHTGV
jgi:hypothetical protein